MKALKFGAKKYLNGNVIKPVFENTINGYKNILVIGGSGLIGSSIVNFLEKNNFTVFVIDKKRKVSTKNFLKYNINEKTNYEKLLNVSIKKFKNIDAVINCIYPAKKVKSKIIIKILLNM